MRCRSSNLRRASVGALSPPTAVKPDTAAALSPAPAVAPASAEGGPAVDASLNLLDELGLKYRPPRGTWAADSASLIQLYQDDVDLTAVADRVGTPFYSYSERVLERDFDTWRDAFATIGFGESCHRACFAVKANDALVVLHKLATLGAGFDIVSVGELRRLLAAGGDPRRVVYSGPGKSDDDIDAAIELGVAQINIEAVDEAVVIAAAQVKHRREISVGLRLNPDLDPRTHPAIATGPRHTKFGLDSAEVETLVGDAARLHGLRVSCVAVHIGSQLHDLGPVVAAAQYALAAALRLRERGQPVTTLDLGGGLAVDESGAGQAPRPLDLARALEPVLRKWDGDLITEPGRAVAARCGLLTTRVVRVRNRQGRRLAICDAGMSALLRPALYGAHHRVLSTRCASSADDRAAHRGEIETQLAGPLCEAGDLLAECELLPELAAGDLVSVCHTGAYGFVMASEYNATPRPAQVWVSGDRFAVVRPRASFEALWADESADPWDDQSSDARESHERRESL